MPALEVPVVPRRFWGPACLALNVFPPGVGTLVAAGNQESRKHLWIGLAQLLLFWTVLPWIWSIVWGVLIYRASEKDLEVRSVASGTHDLQEGEAAGDGPATEASPKGARAAPASRAARPAKAAARKAAKKGSRRA